MVRKSFWIASVFALAALMLVADESQAQRRRFGRRNRDGDYNYSYYGPADSSYYGPADSSGVRSDMDSGQRRYGREIISTQEMPVFIDVSTAANAEISFDGAKTTQTGSRRSFVSPPLKPGSEYTYDIKAKWMENGREVSQSRTIPVRAGQRLTVDLTQASPREREVR